MSQTTNSIDETPGQQFISARNDLFRMIEEGRSFSGHEKNCCFLNTRDGQFANVSALSGIDFPDDGRALVTGDWDHDGDLDIWISNRNAPRIRFLRNDSPRGNGFLAVRLQGNGTTTTRDAIGARVVLTAGDNPPLSKTLRAGEGFLAQSTKWIVFGLGEHRESVEVAVHWPGGEVQRFEALEPNRRYVLHQAGDATVEAERDPVQLEPRETPEPAPVDSYRIPLAQQVPMPVQVQYKAFDGRNRPLAFKNTTLVTLFASWCAPCLKELKEFAEREDEIRDAGLDIVALSVDKLDAGDRQDRAATTIKNLAFPFPAGWADESFVKTMQGYHNFLVPLTRPLPVPTSFLVDDRGHLLAIYKGKVSLDQVLDDARQLDRSQDRPIERAALLPGRVVEHPNVEAVRRDDSLRTRYFLAEVMLETGRLPDALHHLRALVQLHPDCLPAWSHLARGYEKLGAVPYALEAYKHVLELDDSQPWAHFNQGNLLRRMQRDEQAIEAYRTAIRLDPDYVEARVNLGVTLASHDRLNEALEQFERAAELRPDFEPATANLQRVRQLLKGGANP